MQRIFDIENEQDFKDLWSILPDEVYKICRGWGDSIEDNTFFFKKGNASTFLIAINWHDKTEITRPIQEAIEEDIGKICKFWNDDTYSHYGILSNMADSGEDRYGSSYSGYWRHCRRLTKKEIEELIK